MRIQNAASRPDLKTDRGLPDGVPLERIRKEVARWFRRGAGGTLLITAGRMSRRETARRRSPARALFRHLPQMAAVPAVES